MTNYITNSVRLFDVRHSVKQVASDLEQVSTNFASRATEQDPKMSFTA